MIAYLDTSVLLRWVLDSPGQLPLPRALKVERMVSSELLEIESHRALDTQRIRRRWSASELAERRRLLDRGLGGVDLVTLSDTVWRRVRDPYPEPLATLDAAHLATALLLRDVNRVIVETFLTHDPGLASGARAFGFAVLGDAEA